MWHDLIRITRIAYARVETVFLFYTHTSYIFYIINNVCIYIERRLLAKEKHLIKLFLAGLKFPGGLVSIEHDIFVRGNIFYLFYKYLSGYSFYLSSSKSKGNFETVPPFLIMNSCTAGDKHLLFIRLINQFVVKPTFENRKTIYINKNALCQIIDQI